MDEEAAVTKDALRMAETLALEDVHVEEVMCATATATTAAAE